MVDQSERGKGNLGRHRHLPRRAALLGASLIVAVIHGSVRAQQASPQLGEITQALRMGQPLALRIPLLAQSAGQLRGLQVSVRLRPLLASTTQPGASASDLRILIDRSAGNPALILCSEQRMAEPALRLRIGLRTADGGMVHRDYEMLLDPPPAAGDAASDPVQSLCRPAGAAATAATAATARGKRRQTPAAAANGLASSASGQFDSRQFDSRQYGPVRPGESLGTLAQRVRGPRRVALPTLMDAIYRANPAAFAGHPDRLAAGSLLRVPDLGALERGPAVRLADVATPITADAPAPPTQATAGTWLRLSERLAAPPTPHSVPATARRADTAALPPSIAAPAAAEATPTTPPSQARGSGPPRMSGIVIALCLALLLTLIVFGLVRRERRAAAAGTVAPVNTNPVMRMVEPAPAPPAAAVIAASPRVAAPMQAVASADHSPELEAGTDLFEDIARFLDDEVKRQPQRRDLRYKLLELYFIARKREPFIEQTVGYLQSLHGEADANWPEIVRMGRQIAPETGLYADLPPRAAAGPHAQARTATRRFHDGLNRALLTQAGQEIDSAYQAARRDDAFWQRLRLLAGDGAEHPPQFISLQRLSHYLGGAQIHCRDERERPANHSAAISVAGQVLLAQRMRCRRVVAGGLASGHAHQVASAARQLDLGCTVYLSAHEQASDAITLARLKQLGVSVETVRESLLGIHADTQLQALNDALAERHALYVSPTAGGPAPYPTMILDLIAAAGRELRAQMLRSTGRIAGALVVSTADGLHAIGLMNPFAATADTRLHCVDARLDDGAGARVPVAREHGWLRASGRVEYLSIAEEAARFATHFCADGALGSLSPADGEVLAAAIRVARDMTPEQNLVLVLPSGQRAWMAPDGLQAGSPGSVPARLS